MNWRRGLTRLSIVLTVLWGVASFSIAMGELNEAMKAFGGDPAFRKIYAETRTEFLGFALFLWVAGAAIWWTALFAGFWIANGFRK